MDHEMSQLMRKRQKLLFEAQAAAQHDAWSLDPSYYPGGQ
jgi:hypothetical protein